VAKEHKWGTAGLGVIVLALVAVAGYWSTVLLLRQHASALPAVFITQADDFGQGQAHGRFP